MRTGAPDALLENHAGAGRPVMQPMLWFRAEVLRLLDEVAARTGAPGVPAPLRPIAEAIQTALRKAHAPKGCIPSAQTILNLHGKAAHPRTPSDRLLAEVRGSIEASVPGGDGIDARARWIVAELARWPA